MLTEASITQGYLIREQVTGDFCTKGEFKEVKTEQLIKQPQDTEKKRNSCPLSVTCLGMEKGFHSVLSAKHVPGLTVVGEPLPWECYSWEIPLPPAHTFMLPQTEARRASCQCVLHAAEQLCLFYSASAILSKYIMHQSSDSDLMALLQNEDAVITAGRDEQYSNEGHIPHSLTSFSLGWGIYFWHNNGGVGQGLRSSPSYSGIPHHRSHWPCC